MRRETEAKMNANERQNGLGTNLVNQKLSDEQTAKILASLREDEHVLFAIAATASAWPPTPSAASAARG